MAEDKQINPILRQALELGPTVVFFVIYLRIKDNSYTIAGTEYSGFIVAALILVPLLLGAMAVLWALTGKLSRMQIFTALMVIVFGGLTAWFNDERFFKMKTTIVYGLFAGLLGLGLALGQSWLKALMGEMMPMDDAGWMKLTRGLAVSFAVLAVLNEIIWRTQSEETWVKIETFGFPILLMGAFLLIFSRLKDHMIDDE